MDLYKYNKAAQILYFIGFGIGCAGLLFSVILSFDMLFKALGNEQIIYLFPLIDDYYLDVTFYVVQLTITGYIGFVFTLMGFIQGLKMKRGEFPNQVMAIVILIGSFIGGGSTLTFVGAIIALVFINKVNKSKQEAEANRKKVVDVEPNEVVQEEPQQIEEINETIEVQESDISEPPIIK